MWTHTRLRVTVPAERDWGLPNTSSFNVRSKAWFLAEAGSLGGDIATGAEGPVQDGTAELWPALWAQQHCPCVKPSFHSVSVKLNKGAVKHFIHLLYPVAWLACYFVSLHHTLCLKYWVLARLSPPQPCFTICSAASDRWCVLVDRASHLLLCPDSLWPSAHTFLTSSQTGICFLLLMGRFHPTAYQTLRSNRHSVTQQIRIF